MNDKKYEIYLIMYIHIDLVVRIAVILHPTMSSSKFDRMRVIKLFGHKKKVVHKLDFQELLS